MMSNYILPIVVITLLIVGDSVVTQNVSQTSNSNAATPVNLSDVVRHSVSPRHRRETQPMPLSAKQEKEIVDHHNFLRALEGSSNMERLTWNEFLASTAESLAAKCRWGHGEIHHGGNARYKVVGQNLYAGTESAIDLTSAIQAWYDEKQDYTYDTMKCVPGKMCGHYTQLVWATTREVGCALQQCEPLVDKTGHVVFSKALYLVCNYGPPGNVNPDTTRPFIKGQWCSNCRSGAGWCKDKLCNRECSSPGEDCSCAMVCRNCAEPNESTCRCKCASGWHGPDCSERCADKDEKCDPSPGIPGWPPYFCDKHEYIKEYCLVMCKMCTPNPDAVEGQCPTVYGSAADSTWVAPTSSVRSTSTSSVYEPATDSTRSASTSLMKSYHVMMMMMFVMITTITVSISNRDAAL